MEVKQVQIKKRVQHRDLIRFQLLMHLGFLRRESLIDSDLNILCLLAEWGEMDLSDFCNKAASTLYAHMEPDEIYRRNQAIRNRLVKLEARSLVVKPPGPSHKLVALHPSIELHLDKNIRLEYHLLCLEQNE